MDNGSMEPFWEKSKKSFSSLALELRFCFFLLLIFIIGWGFYTGFSYVAAAAPPWDGYLVTGADLVEDDPPPPIVSMEVEEGMEVILLVGVDKRPGDIGRTDTIMLAFINNETEETKILSIPRDTYVTIPRTKEKTKVNHAYAYGGIPLSIATIENLTRIQIDNYVEVDFDGFSQAIDALGGLPYDVDKRMINPSEHIDLYPGMQILDGPNALAYVRYRDGMGDVGRVERQQMFLIALVKEVAKSSNLTRLPKLISICLNNVTTDLSAGQILSLANKVLGEKRDQIEMLTVPGEGVMINGVSYWQVFENQFERLLLYIMGETEEQVISNE